MPEQAVELTAEAGEFGVDRAQQIWVERDRNQTERFENCPFVPRESLRFASFPESRQSSPEIARIGSN